MHKEGLAAGQLGSLLGYTLPVMLSLTLPMAAFFATTIVYGRFSQDNELTACRASGISTLRLLKPAMVLGGVVTVVSLFLSNYVTPQMVALGERSVKANIMGIVRQKFRTQSYIDYSGYYVHADQVEQYPDTLQLRGVVAADARRRTDQRYPDRQHRRGELLRGSGPGLGDGHAGQPDREPVQQPRRHRAGLHAAAAHGRARGSDSRGGLLVRLGRTGGHARRIRCGTSWSPGS